MRTIRASGLSLLGKLSAWNLDDIENASDLRYLQSAPRRIADSAAHLAPPWLIRQDQGKGRKRAGGDGVNREYCGGKTSTSIPTGVYTYRRGGGASSLPQQRAFSMITFNAMNFHAPRFGYQNCNSGQRRVTNQLCAQSARWGRVAREKLYISAAATFCLRICSD